MKIYYQWIPWAYSHKVSLIFANKFNVNEDDINWSFSFKAVFEEIEKWAIWVLPIENSYAWSIHENFYHMATYPVKIIAEYTLKIDHCLLANTHDRSKIKKVYSHPQALMQCEKYLKKYWYEIKEYGDTAWAAKHIKEKWEEWMAAISSDLAANIYDLDIIDRVIQDQSWNSTRFFVIVSEKTYEQIFRQQDFNVEKTNKVSVLFKTKDIPASLYKCLWAFWTRFINLTKIESLPARWDLFEYMFWIDFEKNIEQRFVDEALEELSFFSKDLKILWDY